MKTLALSGLNLPIDNGKERSREAWLKWGENRLTDRERQMGFVAIVGLFESPEYGSYYRVNFAAQPMQARLTLNGRIVR